MLGLGLGGYVFGRWADRRARSAPTALVADYGYFEFAIGLLGLSVSAILPHLDSLSALVSSYELDGNGWHVLSTGSYVGRSAAAVALLGPITLLMGGTLTLLIRHLVRTDVTLAARRIGWLYGANTAGAALGAFLTDYTLVPALGLRGTQSMAALLNLAAAAAALVLGARLRRAARTATTRPVLPVGDVSEHASRLPATFAGVALVLTGFAGMGMEIVWFRHFTLLLGPFRAVYSTLLGVVLAGIGLGAVAAAFAVRRTSRPVRWFVAAQAVLAVAILHGLSIADTAGLSAAAVTVGQTVQIESASMRRWAEIWFNISPVLLEVFIPSLLMGATFPLANAIVQKRQESVGGVAGILYLANTAGAVCGVLTTGLLLLPSLGMQGSAGLLAGVAALAMFPMFWAGRAGVPGNRGDRMMLAVSAAVSVAALWVWSSQPATFIVGRASIRPSADERLLAMREGVNEVVAATEYPGDGRRWLLTNGYPMSSTGHVEQRYMRGLAHIPLLAADRPESVLVIGFGVGNTTHAATLHRSVQRVDVADLSRDILSYAPYFSGANHNVLTDPRVAVFVNDGRHHLQMQPPSAYDVITLEPPPIAHAGVGALYSRDFYALARSRLKAGGYISQWLPAYQVPAETTLSILRAFLDEFPQAVLLSGAQPNLLLVGANGSPIEIDPARLERVLEEQPAVKADLERVDLGSVRELVGTFVAAASTLQRATRFAVPVSDDRPLQEYSVGSLINFGIAGVPASIVDLAGLGEWCPACLTGTAVPGLDTYMAILARAYMVSWRRSADLSDPDTRAMIERSTYVQLLMRNAATARNEMGVRLASHGRLEQAAEEFREALALSPGLTAAGNNLSAVLNARNVEK